METFTFSLQPLVQGQPWSALAERIKPVDEYRVLCCVKKVGGLDLVGLCG